MDVETPAASFVRDYAFEDDVKLAPGARFTKAWTLRNCGSMPWGSELGTRLVHRFGPACGTHVDVSVPLAQPGEEVAIFVNMVAPASPGIYKSEWSLAKDDGNRFGPLIYAQFEVVEGLAAVTFVRDVTLPDGSEVEPGTLVKKTWRLRNTGACNLAGHALCFCWLDGSSLLGASSTSVAITSVCPGEDFEVSVDLCPQSSGRGIWRILGPAGMAVAGSPDVWVELRVVGADLTLRLNKLDGSVACLTIASERTVQQLKQLIFHRTGIPVSDQIIMLEDQMLDDDAQVLSHLAIQDGSYWQLIHSENILDVIVVTLSQHRINLSLTSTISVEDVKGRIQDSDGIPADQQRLIYNGRELDNSRRLADYGIQSGATLHLVLRLRGKPVIYVYPEEPLEVQVDVAVDRAQRISAWPPPVRKRLKDSELLSWKCHAWPDGILAHGQRRLPYLFWDAIHAPRKGGPVQLRGDDGKLRSCACIPGAESAEWLDEVLELQGLNDRERVDFITFWQPQLEANTYNLIRFLSSQEIDEDSRLIIAPAPATIVRVFMIFERCEKPICTVPQLFMRPQRQGFTVVEWGGSACDDFTCV